MIEKIREYVLSTLGTLVTAVGVVVFLIPNNIAAGGVSGLSMILHHLLPLPVGIWMYILNGLLFLVAFLTVGFDFSAKTIYCTFVFNFFVDLFDRLIPLPKYTGDDLFLAVSFGTLLTALGLAITFSQNSSTGGTDIIARILNKYFWISMGMGLLMVDFTIAALAGVTFNARTGMYALLGVILNGIMVDFMLRGIEQSSEVTIISERSEEIKDFVLYKLHRGATYVPAKGAYTGKERKILLVVVRRRELNELIRFIRKVDPKAFVVIKEVRQALGEGFKELEEL
ncbi:MULTISPECIES: YitT family protein [Thermotoga]|uniref:DUF2179 domain-containing protein n=2 Tax=Thermotoga neapolitana TaxID=2337 RepID=B9K6V3_THENN|nr:MULTISPECIES: YitT family protein [Thermotoga]MDK2785587.1 hypothetical protein [Thermotoga sp.]CAI44232.1 hypothetical protein [Thermotoga neapolitana]ACM22686.1 Putative uncharacterized protein [Thermotoga neapolitana DSM 4359]AJG40632.1 transporter [Thermotoga sp. RQ7]KFZ22314.1 hypothetical protein LA10_02557 [Thermotoga neapolitana LA10]